MEWVRRWQYELRWAPRHSGVFSRTVDTVAQLRAVVERARRNPHIEKCSYKAAYEPNGDWIAECSRGHSLAQPKHWETGRRSRRHMNRKPCLVCPGHYLSDCPECLEEVFDPPLGPDCSPA